MRRSCSLCPNCVARQTSVWKQSLVLMYIFHATFILVPPTFLQFKCLRELVQNGGEQGLFWKKNQFLTPQHWPLSSMQSLYTRSIGSTRVRPPGGSVHLALLSVGCKPPRWGVSLGPGSGRWSGSGASGHLWSESEVHKRTFKMKGIQVFQLIPLHAAIFIWVHNQI